MAKTTKKPAAKKAVPSKSKTTRKTSTVKPKAKKETKIPKPTFEPFCVFCGAPPEAVPRLIVSEYNFAICHECVERCNSVLLSEDFDPTMKAKDKINWRKTLTELLAQPKEYFILPEVAKTK